MKNEVFVLSKSERKDKKWKVVVYKEGKKIKTINFGASGLNDYILYSKEEKKLANKKKSEYIARHSKLNEDWTDPYTPGFWSRFLLWEEPTLKRAVQKIRKAFGINLKVS